jgi:small GTP-binding protein
MGIFFYMATYPKGYRSFITMEQESTSIHCLFLGSFGVGKTTFIRQLLDLKQRPASGSFANMQVFTGKASGIHNAEMLTCWDFVDQSGYQHIPEGYFEKSERFIVMFDVHRPATLQFALEQKHWIKENYPNKSILLVGNKLDLVSNSLISEYRKLYTQNVCLVNSLDSLSVAIAYRKLMEISKEQEQQQDIELRPDSGLANAV